MKPIYLTKQLRQSIEQLCRQTHDKRIYQRLTALLLVADGRTRQEVASILGITRRCLHDWLRLFRQGGVEAICALHYKGDPGKLTASQVEQLQQEISTGRFHNAAQIRLWLAETFQVHYTSSGVKDLLKRIGASYHKVSGFLWKAKPDKQQQFLDKYRRQKRQCQQAGQRIRRYCIDACHPVWGVELVYYCWLLVGQRHLVGMGSGRKRLNILGAYCPDDQEYLDLRLTRDNINGEQFVNLLRLLRERHPETEKFILYVDGAKYYQAPVVKEWLSRHPEFHLEQLPAYSPNLNLIERLWKFLRAKALKRWHKTFADMQAAVGEVLDNLSAYREELATLMVENFQIVKKEEIPPQYLDVA